MTKNHIRTKPEPLCKCCHSEGTYLYKELKDRLFGVEGEWHLKKCNNTQCGLIWQDPMPIEEDIGLAYQTYYTHQDNAPTNKANFVKRVLKTIYSKAKRGYLFKKYKYHADAVNSIDILLGYLLYLYPGRRAVVDFEVFYLPAKPNGKLLEIGCGSGVMLKTMKDLGWSIEGIDFDPNAVNNASKKGLNVKLGGLIEQNYPDKSYDAIVMSHLIEHVPDPINMIIECFRIMKDGSVLVLITPNSNSFGHKVFQENWRGLEPPRHLNIFDANSIVNLLKFAKFSRLAIITTIRDANGMIIASDALKNNGSYRMGEQVTLTKRLWGVLMQMLEWTWLKFNKHIGEEIVVKAIK